MRYDTEDETKILFEKKADERKQKNLKMSCTDAPWCPNSEGLEITATSNVFPG